MNCNKMTCFRLYKYAKETREAQKAYFRSRDINDLCTAKALERELDKAIDTYAREVLQQKGDEAAWRETRGNAAAMLEALKKAELGLFRWLSGTMNRDEHRELVATIKEALAAPARNCDVGTELEQAERYRSYCDKFTLGGMHCETCPCCGKIPFGKCEFAWANMPYKEGDAK